MLSSQAKDGGITANHITTAGTSGATGTAGGNIVLTASDADGSGDSNILVTGDLVAHGGDSTSATGTHIVGDSLVGRQLRSQDDSDAFYDYQFEPVWKFDTASIHHTLLTGFEYQRQILDTTRTTADLPNITNIFAPTPPELSANSLVFQCDAKHSCDQDHLVGDFYGVYATDQIDLTDKWKLRLGLRQDWFNTELDPLITVPTSAANPAPSRFTSTGVPIIAGIPQVRNDQPVSWNAPETS